jgi:hypothetical protein
MSVKDQYIDLCEARVEALANEVRLLREFIIRDHSLKGISAEGAMKLFDAFKSNYDETQV